MILGEAQILGQMKSFYQAAVDAGTVGAHLNSLLQAAFHTAKRVRSETNIGEYAVSVSSAAVELARKIFGNLGGARVLIVGAGKMGELACRQLGASGVGTVRVANRSTATAQELAAKFRGEVVPFNDLVYWIARSDIVITSTGSQEILIDHTAAQSVLASRKTPVVFIDISVPRNVDPKVGTIENAFYYDVDDLGAVVEANLQERRREATLGEKIVEQEVEAFRVRLRSADITPVVVQLQGRIQEICQAELQRYVKKAGPLDEAERQELEIMVSRIANKIAHPLISQMRSNSDNSSHQSAYLEIIKRVFKLQKSTES
jgi:glutamyl-tRNA reductase